MNGHQEYRVEVIKQIKTKKVLRQKMPIENVANILELDDNQCAEPRSSGQLIYKNRAG